MTGSQVRTLPAIEEGQSGVRDHSKGGFSLSALEALVNDCQGQPDWRPRADIAHAYYDMGKQLTHEQAHRIRMEMGIEPRQTNLIHGVINGVLGQEAKARSDVRVEADDDDYADVSDCLSKAMKEAMRETNSDMAVSNGYAGQVKGGIGWVEVSRSSDPLDYAYRVQEVHRNEIWYDWRARHLGLDDGRWLVRKRWEDLDETIALMPQHADILKQAVNGWDIVALPDDTNSFAYRAYNNERRTTINRDEWCDSTRKRIKLFEVWYRVPAEVVVLHLGPTRRVMYDETNPLHVVAVSRGRVKISKMVTRQIRRAIFAGPHRLTDVGTTLRSFPYVPFFAFRDDEDRSPYGLIEGMISPQDEYNERRQMINWMLKARQMQIDADALDTDYNTIADVVADANRPDSVAVMNPNRRNANGLVIKNDLTLQKEQIDVMLDAKQLIQEVPRVYSTQLGDTPAGVTSGVAINSLTEAGAIAMGELNDNYSFARRRVHERLLDLIVEDHLTENMRVTLGAGQNKRVVVLNSWGPQGEPTNRVKDAPIKVGLSDVPMSPAFRVQEQQQVGVMIQALRENAAAVNILAPAYIEGSSLSNRQAIADDLRRATGVPVAGDREAQKQRDAQQAEELAQAKQVAAEAAAADIAEKQTKALVNQSTADLNNAKTEQIGHTMVMDEAQLAISQQQPDPSSPDQLIEEAALEAAGR